MEFNTPIDFSVTPAPVTPVDREPIDFFSEKETIPVSLSSDDVELRSEKYSYALNGTEKQESLYNQIVTGQEKHLRERLAFQKGLQNQNIKKEILGVISREKQGPLTPEQFEFIQALSAPQLENPDIILETEFAKKIFSDTFYDEELVDEALKEDVEKTNSLLDLAEDTVAFTEVIRKTVEDSNTEWNKLPAQDKFGEFLETWIPFVSWSNISNDPKGDSLLGTNLRDQVIFLWNLPLTERVAAFKQRFAEIKAINSFDAARYAEAVISYGNADEYWDNAFSILDISSVVPSIIGTKALVKLASGIKATSQTINGQRKGLSLSKVFSAAGKTGQAAAGKTAQDLGSALKEWSRFGKQAFDRDRTGQLKELVNKIPSFSDPFSVVKGSYRLAREGAERLMAGILRAEEALFRGLADKTSLERLSSAALDRAVVKTIENFKIEYPRANDAILDITHLNAATDNANIHNVAIDIGQPQGQLFANRNAAGYWARTELKLPKGSYDLIDNGNGTFIRVTRAIDETHPEVRDLLIQTDNVTPQSAANTFLAGRSPRSAEDLLPASNLEARKILVHGTQNLLDIARIFSEPIKDLSKTSRELFLRFTSNVRHRGVDPLGNPLPGDFFRSLGDFENAWMDMTGRLPTEKEATAYFSYVRFQEYNHILRNMGIYRAKARQGISSFSLSLPRGHASGLKETVEFDGKLIPKIDLDNLHGNAGILIWDPKKKSSVFLTKQRAGTETNQKLLDDLVNQKGYKIIQIANPFRRPLREGIGNNSIIGVVVTKDFNNRRLPYDQIAWKPGGPIDYDYKDWVKQPVFEEIDGRLIYFGDRVLRPTNTVKEAARSADAYEQARLLARDVQKGVQGKFEEFRTWVANNLPDKPYDLLRRFQTGLLSLHHPIKATVRGRRLIDDQVYKQSLGEFEDSTRSQMNLLKDTEFEYGAQESWLGKEGTEENPLFKIEAPKVIDPLTLMNRAAIETARNEYLESYRILSAEHFIQEFWDMMKTPLDRLRAHPVAHLLKPTWDENTPNRNKLAAAKNFQRSVVDLMNIATPMSRDVRVWSNKLHDWIFEKGLEKTAKWVDEKFVSTIEDPVRFARRVAFHTKLGMFNITQLFKQAQTFTHILGVAGPKIALKAAPVYTLQRALLLSNGSEDLIRHFGKMSEKFGWKQEEFKEAFDALRQSGLHLVEGEHAFGDDLADPKLWKSGWGGWFLDKGQFAFREGERFTRLTAFNAAYLEWRAAHPFGKFDRTALSKVLKRQDLLNVNMTRASNASWQKGFLSIPTQFLSYQLRLWEQFLGKRLTKIEKARAIGMYSVMYGVPVGVGGTLLGGFVSPFPFGIGPWYEDITSYLKDNAIEYNNPAIELFHKGILEMATHLITGRQTNIGESFGPGGLSLFKDLADGETSLFELLTGASGNILSTVANSTYPVVADLKNIAEPGGIKVLGSDLADALRVVSSFNNGFKMLVGLSAGKAMTKGEVALDDVNTQESLLMGILGINPQSLDDVGIMIDILKGQKDVEDFAEKQIIKYIRKALKAEDEPTRLAYYRQASTWFKLGDFRTETFKDIFSRAVKGYENLLDSLNNRMLMDAPQSKREQRLKSFMERQE